jgi:hypothetical protein
MLSCLGIIYIPETINFSRDRSGSYISLTKSRGVGEGVRNAETGATWMQKVIELHPPPPPPPPSPHQTTKSIINLNHVLKELWNCMTSIPWRNLIREVRGYFAGITCTVDRGGGGGGDNTYILQMAATQIFNDLICIVIRLWFSEGDRNDMLHRWRYITVHRYVAAKPAP